MRDFGRRGVLGGAIAVAAAAATGGRASAAAAPQVPAIWREFARNPYSHPQIPYIGREGSHDNLVEDFTLSARTVPAPSGTQLHGINVEGLSSYNVWSRGRMEMGTFDSHRGMPFANVRTDVTVNNNGRHGGDASAGPLFGARFTHWNIRVTNGRAGLTRIDGLAPYSATVGINTVREFDQIDVPDFEGDLGSRLELYGTTNAVRPRNLHEAQQAL